jgi:ferredoxin
MNLQVHVDRCMGAGQCVLAAPDVFDQDEDGTIVQVGLAEGHEAAVRSAAHACPAQVIEVSPIQAQ